MKKISGRKHEIRYNKGLQVCRFKKVGKRGARQRTHSDQSVGCTLITVAKDVSFIFLDISKHLETYLHHQMPLLDLKTTNKQ